MDTRRRACRIACYTAALLASLWAPALVQAALLLHPRWLAADHAAAAMSLVLAGTITACSTLMKALLERAGDDDRR